MNRYEKEALADIQANSDKRLEALTGTIAKLMDDLPVGTRPRLSRRIKSGIGMYRAVDASRRLYEALCALKAMPSTPDTDDLILDLEDRAGGALFELVEALK